MEEKSFDPENVPGWAKPIQRDVDMFISLVLDYFHARRLDVELHYQGGVVTPRLGTADHPVMGVLNLHGLARQCAQHERAQWRQVIHDYLDRIFAANEGDTQRMLGLGARSFSEVAGRLRARLYPQALLSQAKDILCRPGPEGTIEALVLDLPTAVRTISAVEAERWGLTPDSLFEAGRDSLRRALPERVQQFAVGNEIVLHIFSGDSYYTASGLLIADDLFPPHLPHGALVSIPRHDVLIAHYIHNIGVVEALGIMARVATQMHEEEPGALTTNIYWYIDGECVHIPCELTEDGVEFSPPEAFEALLESLQMSALLS